MPNGKPGDHPFTDMVVHQLDLVGGGVDGEMRQLLVRFPGAEAELRAYLESKSFGDDLAVIAVRQDSVRLRVLEIWNKHMKSSLEKRGL